MALQIYVILLSSERSNTIKQSILHIQTSVSLIKFAHLRIFVNYREGSCFTLLHGVLLPGMLLDAGEWTIGDRGGRDRGGLPVFCGHHHAGGSGAAGIKDGRDRIALSHPRPLASSVESTGELGT